jgi:hypothetical protein
LYGVDRERGAKILATDSMGVDSAGTYKRLIETLRGGEIPLPPAGGWKVLPPGAGAV